MSQWIWNFGDYEIYHNLLVHNRRQHYGYPEPVIWKLYAPEPVVRFRKKVTTSGGQFCIKACGDTSVIIYGADGSEKKLGGVKNISLAAGTVEIHIRVANMHTFPCIYVDGVIESDASWQVDDMSCSWKTVGTYECFGDPLHSPDQFPFEYETITYADSRNIKDGILFDFGRVTFARIMLTQLSRENVTVQFGESEEEALDERWSVIHFQEILAEGQDSLSYEPYAFRYIYVSDPGARIQAQYEYLPVEYRGAFSSDEEIVNRVWSVAAYTFHLNCREFFLDGIKRDRWVWAADVYQSLFVNHYLFMDQEIEKRTLIALGGKTPVTMHINTIMDYSFFWFISIYEYYITYGDKEFLCQIAPQMSKVMEFCRGRTDEDDFMRERPGDWVFIDWAEMDKQGALCGEQILYAKAMECYGELGGIIGMDGDAYKKRAEQLQQKILEYFYDEESGVFIDSYESGQKSVTRQTNILAYLFLPCSEEQKRRIYERVILNEEVRQITTPYFKFYENQVHCLAGNSSLLEECIRNYYGRMLENGATTLYEEHDPGMSGAEHYAMYGNPYEKSLCHAWSASPVYLLGRFRMGVRNTGVAYNTFEVRPDAGDLKCFDGQVPIVDGTVWVSLDEHEIRVRTDRSGGTFIYGDHKSILKPGEEIVLSRHIDRDK